MARLIWAPQAVEDLDATCEFTGRDSEFYARAFAERLVSATDVLVEFPRAGRQVPEFGDDSLRELLFGHYRIIYELAREQVQILTVHHAARLLRERP